MHVGKPLNNTHILQQHKTVNINNFVQLFITSTNYRLCHNYDNDSIYCRPWSLSSTSGSLLKLVRKLRMKIRNLSHLLTMHLQNIVIVFITILILRFCLPASLK